MAKKQREESGGVEDPAPATEMTDAGGAIVEDEVKSSIETTHPAVDDNPRAGTTAEMNQQDWNDPGGVRRDDDGNVVATGRPRRPGDPDYVGQGLDPMPYGKRGE